MKSGANIPHIKDRDCTARSDFPTPFYPTIGCYIYTPLRAVSIHFIKVEANTGCVISLGFINAWRCKARDSTPTVQQDIVLTVLMAVSIQIGTNIQVRKNWL